MSTAIIERYKRLEVGVHRFARFVQANREEPMVKIIGGSEWLLIAEHNAEKGEPGERTAPSWPTRCRNTSTIVGLKRFSGYRLQQLETNLDAGEYLADPHRILLHP